MSILIGYEKTMYAWLVGVFIFVLVVYRFLYHVKKPLLFGAVGIVCGFFIFQYIQYAIQKQTHIYESGFVYTNKTQVEIETTLKEFPSYRFSNNQYVVQVKNSSTQTLVLTHPYQKFKYLDTLNISGVLIDVRSQGEEWQGYYKKLNVQYVVFYPNIIGNHSNIPVHINQKIMRKIFDFKMYIRTKVIEKFSSHTSALILGMLLGEKDELSKEEKELFTRANLSHILVVSGYNISLVLSFVFILLKSFHRYIRINIALFCVFFFVLLVGFDPSVVRSALMGMIVVLTQMLYRQSSGIHTLCIAAFLMLLYNPFSIFDAGFHLSFLATYSLFILPRFKKIPEYIMTTLWVSGFVSPYILYLSGSLSYIGIAINIAVLFFIPIFMLVSFGSLLISIIHLSVGIDILILEALTRYIFLMTQVAQLVSPIIYKISPHIGVIFYLGILSTLSFIQNRYTTQEFIEKRYQKFVPQRPS